MEIRLFADDLFKDVSARFSSSSHGTEIANILPPARFIWSVTLHQVTTCLLAWGLEYRLLWTAALEIRNNS